MAYDGSPVTLRKQVVVDEAYIANANMAYAWVFDEELDLFGKELVLEDGCITEVHTDFKRIIGGNKVIVTVDEIEEMARKLNSVAESFGTLAVKCDDADFAIYGYYRKAEEAFKKAREQVAGCLAFCPKGHYGEAKDGE